VDIQRIDTGDRMSQAVVHGNTAYTAGQVARNAKGGSITAQTEDILARIDELLKQAGTGKENVISATIWLDSMDHFAEMNTVWDAWVSPGNTPCRACVESRLASPDFSVEISVIAAVPGHEA